MIRKLFIVLLCFMFVPIVCSQALGAAWYVTELTEGTSITYAQDDSTTDYTPGKWSEAVADSETKTFRDFFSNKVQADDIVYIKDGTFSTNNQITIDTNVTIYGGFKDGDSGIDSRTGSTTIKSESLNGLVIRNGYKQKPTVSLDGLTITGGNVSDNGSCGGGVYNYKGTLTMTNCTVSGNKMTGNETAGGGVYNLQGTLTMANCTIADNTANSYGGGAYNYEGTLTMTNCTISGNTVSKSGGGVYNAGGTVTMTNCTVSGNKTTGQNGGGVYSAKGKLTMTNCTVSDNTATSGVGVYNWDGTLTMKNTFVWGDVSNLIYNSGTITATYSAFPSGLSVTGVTLGDTTQNNIAISSWSNQTPKEVTVNRVTHTVYRIEDNSELSALEGKGTKADDTPDKDQLGHTRYNPPCIGAVEIVKPPVLSPETLTIDAIESKAITAQTITVTQGLDIILSTSGTLPDGLTTESTDTTFTISGTPAAGTAANSPYTYNVTASNDASKTTTIVTVNFIIAPVLSYDKEITLTEGEAMTDFTITATNKDIVKWSSSGALPDGLTPSNKDNTFTITGTPASGTAANSPYTYTVTAENAAGKKDAIITIIVIAKPVFAETEIAYTGTEGSEISPITITATSGNNLTWSASGTLPEGLTVSSKDNVFTISGTLKEGTAANSPYNYTVTAANTAGQASAKVTITVKEEGSAAVAPVFAETDIAYTGTEGREISPITITATSGNNLTWSASGTLPEGLTVSSKDNVFTISGTPASGTAANSPYKYTVTAANTAGYASAVVTITITSSGNGGNHDPESVKPVLSESAINHTYQGGYTIENIVIRATAGENLTWSASGTLPDGLTGAESNNKTSYTISGKLEMETTGSYTYTVTAKNDAGEANCTVNITVETFVLSTDNLPEPETNQTLGEYLSDTLGLSPEQLKMVEDFKVPSKITDLSGIADLMPNLKTLDLTAAESLGENIDLSVLGNLQLEKVNLSGNSAVKTLNLKGCNIQNVNAEGCTELVSIDVAGNEFIEELQVGSTDISEINTSGCKNLKTLHFANSKVSKLDLTGCVEMRDLDFYNNRVRRFHKDHFGLDKLSKLNAKNQRAYKSLIGRIFDLVAFMLDYDEGDISTAGLVINSAVNSGDENLINVTGYDESDNAIEYDDSEYPETGKIIFDEAPATIIYNYDTGLNSMDVTISGTPDDDEDSYLGSPGGGCDSGFSFGALLALAGLALTRRK